MNSSTEIKREACQTAKVSVLNNQKKLWKGWRGRRYLN